MSGYDLTDCPDLSPYAGDYRPDIAARGVEAIRDDLLGAVKEALEAHPRSLQREIGPSQIGHPCPRWLAYFFADVPPAGLQAPKWRAAVGTCVHDGFSGWLHDYNQRHGFRFLTDLRVWVGDLYPGRPITGSLDALDTWTATIIDLKVPGPSSMKRHAGNKPEDEQYAVQFDGYGCGALNAGYPVQHVGSLRLPAAGELADAIWKVRPHNPQRAADALTRAGTIARLTDTVGPQAAAMVGAVEHHCGTCEWHRPGSTDLTQGCPGAATFLAAHEQAASRRASVDDLVA